MSYGHWLLVVQVNDPGRVIPHWMDDEDLAHFGIKGQVGEEYQLDEDDEESRRRVVGAIRGRSTQVWDMLVELVDTLEGSNTVSQELRFTAFAEIVECVTRAVERARTS